MGEVLKRHFYFSLPIANGDYDIKNSVLSTKLTISFLSLSLYRLDIVNWVLAINRLIQLSGHEVEPVINL